MRIHRYLLLPVLAALIPACGGKKTTIVQNITNGSSTILSPFPITGTGASGTTGFNESGGVGGLGSDGQPRSVYVSSDGTNLQIRFARRNPDGTWSAILPISTNDTDLKDQVTVYVTPNNNYTHIFWLQGATTAVYRLHYAQVNNDAVPALTVSDTNLSTGPSTHVGIGATYGRVTTFTTAIDPLLNNIYSMWVQSVQDGGLATDIPLAGAVIGGAGLFTERFALITPTGAAFNSATTLPILRVATSGRVHAAWVAGTGNTAVFHRLRTAVDTWSSGPAGNQVSTFVAGSGSTPAMDLSLAPSGNAYVCWTNAAFDVRAAYRPVGDASVFATETVAGSQAGLTKLIAVLEPGTENFHIVGGASGPVGTGFVYTTRNPAAGLGGAWEHETLINAASSNPGAIVDFSAWADSTNHVVVVLQSPSVSNDLPQILSTVRPTGAGIGLYSPFQELTAAGALPCTNLTVARDSAGNAVVAWEQGQDTVVPLGEIFGALYTTGGTFGGTFNVSDTPAVGSHGPIFALLSDAGPGYISWLEAVASGPNVDNVYFALKP